MHNLRPFHLPKREAEAGERSGGPFTGTYCRTECGSAPIISNLVSAPYCDIVLFYRY